MVKKKVKTVGPLPTVADGIGGSTGGGSLVVPDLGTEDSKATGASLSLDDSDLERGVPNVIGSPLSQSERKQKDPECGSPEGLVGETSKAQSTTHFESPSVSRTLGDEDTDLEVSQQVTQQKAEGPVNGNGRPVNGNVNTPVQQGMAVKPTWVKLFTETRNNRDPNLCGRLQAIPTKGDKVRLGASDVHTVIPGWDFSLMGYFAGRFPGKAALTQLCNSWKVQYRYQFHSTSWIIFKFENENAKKAVLLGGPYLVHGQPLLLKTIPDFFQFDEEGFTLFPVWVKLKALPLQCWHPIGLSMIATRIGNPIYTDKFTVSMERLEYARVLVEIDISKPLVRTVPIELPNGVTRNQPVEYEYMPKFCKICKSFGHNLGECKKSKQKGPEEKLEAGNGDGQHVAKESGQVAGQVEGQAFKQANAPDVGQASMQVDATDVGHASVQADATDANQVDGQASKQADAPHGGQASMQADATNAGQASVQTDRPDVVHSSMQTGGHSSMQTAVPDGGQDPKQIAETDGGQAPKQTFVTDGGQSPKVCTATVKGDGKSQCEGTGNDVSNVAGNIIVTAPSSEGCNGLGNCDPVAASHGDGEALNDGKINEPSSGRVTEDEPPFQTVENKKKKSKIKDGVEGQIQATKGPDCKGSGRNKREAVSQRIGVKGRNRAAGPPRSHEGR